MGQIGYLGNQGHHMLDRSYVNLIDPATGTRALPAFGRVDIKSSGSSTNFNGLQMSLQRPFSAGFLMGAQYMWSHAFDEGSLGGGESTAPQNVSCRTCEYAQHQPGHPSHADGELGLRTAVRCGPAASNSGTLSHIFGGWTFSGLTQARTGRPLTISVTRSTADLPDGNNAGQRPDIVPGVSAIPGDQNPDHWLNIEAFAVPGRGTWGNLGRNTLRGPGLFQVDLALQRGSRWGAAATSSSAGRRSTRSTTRTLRTPTRTSAPGRRHSAASPAR